jgi:thioredoxin 1
MSAVNELTSENFDTEVLQSDKPYLVDFWASWCGPCRAVAPIVEQLAEDMAGSINVGKLNVDDEQAIAQRYRVMSIPTIILFKDGQTAAVSVGAVPKDELLRRIEPYI